ncbi:APC family permease [Acidihalobacter prosperus]|uniref:Amino acid permease n=1 Tax=Acidihalobacter prosperus TaxID=160660 RepID=A0A1A6C2P2_9GAMM|nr:APC family permease [Acidihalobacter prosperus]OBS08831.1 amino acid permease [Acidihalobacter prosperus]
MAVTHDAMRVSTGAGKLRREAGILSLLFACLGGMIGSGWLFGPLNAAKAAGPASLLSWVIGGAAILLLAFVYAELATAFPRAGAVVAFPKLSHGNLMAMVMSWVVFLGYVSVPPVEVMAVLSYANNYLHGLVSPHTGVLTTAGFFVAAAMLGGFVLLNGFGIRWLLRINTTLVWWKLAVPALTILALLLFSFHAGNGSVQGFAPYGSQGVLSAVATSGIVFSYLGFRQAVELAGESRDPKRTIPKAVIGSVVLALGLYLLLQLAMIYGVAPGSIAHGWANLHFAGIAGPFAGMAALAGLGWLALLLYIDAVISPGGTGIIYSTTASRVVYATGNEGLMSALMSRVTDKGVPWVGLLVTYAFGVFFFFPFPSWQKLVGYISSVTVLSYGIGPVVLLSLRKTLPVADHGRPFLLRWPWLIAPIAFIVSNYIIYWSGAGTDDFLFGMLAVFFLIYLGYELATRRSLAHLEWRGAWWLLPYFVGMWLITYLGPKSLTGGLGDIVYPWGMVIIAVFSLAIIFLARASAMLDPEEARATLLGGEPGVSDQRGG